MDEEALCIVVDVTYVRAVAERGRAAPSCHSAKCRSFAVILTSTNHPQTQMWMWLCAIQHF